MTNKEVQFERIFHKSLDVMIVVRIKGLQMEHISDVVHHYLGYSPKELIGKPLKELFPPEKKTNRKELMKYLRTVDAVFTDQTFLHEDGSIVLMDLTATPIPWDDREVILVTLRGTEERRAMEAKQNRLLEKLRESINKVKLLSGFLPICAHCKSIRDDRGYWSQVEEYVSSHSEADFSHGICPDCQKKHYSQFLPKDEKQ